MYRRDYQWLMAQNPASQNCCHNVISAVLWNEGDYSQSASCAIFVHRRPFRSVLWASMWDACSLNNYNCEETFTIPLSPYITLHYINTATDIFLCLFALYIPCVVFVLYLLSSLVKLGYVCTFIFLCIQYYIFIEECVWYFCCILLAQVVCCLHIAWNINDALFCSLFCRDVPYITNV